MVFKKYYELLLWFFNGLIKTFLTLVGGLLGGFSAIWLMGRLEFLRQLSHMQIWGVTIDSVLVAAISGGTFGVFFVLLLIWRRADKR